MKKSITLLLVVAAALLSFVGGATATAAPALALTCPGGSLCVWPVVDGSHSRCSWNNADNDWRNAPVICSWASSSTVKAVYNNGTSPNYAGVCLYLGAGYTNPYTFVGQGDTKTFSGISALVRSHKWLPHGQAC
jgi:hypothetical protein